AGPQGRRPAAVRRATTMRRRNGLVLAGGALAPLPTSAAHAPPPGNFAICHHARPPPDQGENRVRFIPDLGQIPTVGEKEALDRDRDGAVRGEERAAYLAAKAPELLRGLRVTVNGVAAPLRRVAGQVQLAPGAGGLDTLKIVLDLEAPLAGAGPWR